MEYFFAVILTILILLAPFYILFIIVKNKIKAEMKFLKEDYDLKINLLQIEIDKLKLTEEQIIKTREIPYADNTKIEILPKTDKIQEEEENLEVTIQEEIKVEAVFEEKDDESNNSKEIISETVFTKVKESTLAPILINLFSPLLNPFSQLYDYLLKMYNHYKKENKLPIFFLTVMGIAATVVGFSYILQYSFDNFLNEVSKTTVGFVFAVAVIFVGLKLFNKDEKFRDFGSGIVGLGLLLNYTNIYFLATYYALVPLYIGFFLVLLNTVIATFLALKLEAKVIAVLTLVGGALSPFYLSDNSNSTSFYYPYLLILTFSINYISKKIDWELLRLFSFSLMSIVIEIYLFSSNSNNNLFLSIPFLHLFSYLFLYEAIFSGRKIVKKLDRNRITLFVGSIVLLVLNIYFTLENLYLAMGFVYLLNTIPFGVLSFYKKIDRKMKVLFISIASMYLGLTILSFSDSSLVGIFWGIEALLLVYLGSLYQFKTVRKEGYFLFFTALINSVFVIIGEVYNEGLAFDKTAYLNLFISGILIYLLLFILKRFNQNPDRFEHKLTIGVNELFSLFLALIYSETVFLLFPNYFFILSIFPLLGFIYYGCKKKLVITQVTAYLHYAFLILGIYLSVTKAGSYRFSAQNTIGQIVIAETFLSLWFLQFYYEKLFPTHKIVPYLKKARLLFYLILPLLMINPIRRNFPEYLSFALWGSVVISFTLYTIVKDRVLKKEFYLLLYLTAIFGFFKLLKSDSNIELFSASCGLFLLLSLLSLKQSRKKKGITFPGLVHIYQFTYYFTVAYIFFVSFSLTGFVAFAILLSLIYLLLLVIYRSKIIDIRNNFHLIYLMAKILFFLLFPVMISENDYFISRYLYIFLILSVLGLFMRLIYFDRSLYYKIISLNTNHTKFLYYFDNYLIHIYYFMIYFVLITLVDKPLGLFLTIALTVHSVVLIFQTMKVKYKFLNYLTITIFGVIILKLYLIDLKDFNMIEKIITFMIIGVTLLMAAYIFQRVKIKNSLQEKVDEKK